MPSPIFRRPGPETRGDRASQLTDVLADWFGAEPPELDPCDRPGRRAGQSDIARALSLSRQRIGQYRKLSDFPKPVQNVNGAPVWILGEVLEWHEARVSAREAKR